MERKSEKFQPRMVASFTRTQLGQILQANINRAKEVQAIPQRINSVLNKTS